MSRVFVYRNLHRNLFSIRDVKSGLVVEREPVVALAECKLKVGKAGRERVLREGKKNVHAGVQGVKADQLPPDGAGWVKVTYNPYKFDSFVRCDTLEPVLTAAYVKLDINGGVYAYLAA